MPRATENWNRRTPRMSVRISATNQLSISTRLRLDQRHDFFRDEDAVSAAKVIARIELAQHPPLPRSLNQATGLSMFIGDDPAKTEGSRSTDVSAIHRAEQRGAKFEKDPVELRVIVPDAMFHARDRRVEIKRGRDRGGKQHDPGHLPIRS